MSSTSIFLFLGFALILSGCGKQMRDFIDVVPSTVGLVENPQPSPTPDSVDNRQGIRLSTGAGVSTSASGLATVRVSHAAESSLATSGGSGIRASVRFSTQQTH